MPARKISRGKREISCNLASAGSQETGAMNTIPLCPSCRAPIPPDAPGGLCPVCALLGAARSTGAAGGFSMPSREEVAAAFPDLEILESAGAGGMGIVFKVRQPRLDRLAALKILPPMLAERPGFAERFTREGRALAKLNHPNIVTVYDFGASGGFFYLLMEYVNGVNLRRAMQTGIRPEQAMLLVPRICEALQFAHDHGVLHRDIKPENILLDLTGTPKLADFGIAKLAGEAAGGITLSGAALGTAAYMAPEQIEKPGTVDHRADIYSLGVVFYEMLTGELPLGRFAAPSSKATIAPGVDEVVLRALEKERALRQQSATEMRTEVEGVRDYTPPEAPRKWHQQSIMKHLLELLFVLSALGIPITTMIARDGMPSRQIIPPLLMVLAAAAFLLLRVFWPSSNRPRSFTRHLLEFLTIAGAAATAVTTTIALEGITSPQIIPPLPVGLATVVLFILAALWPSPEAPRRRVDSAEAPRRRDVDLMPRPTLPGERRSRRNLFGLPLYHIVSGMHPVTGRPMEARGILAMGPVAKGFIAMGGRAHGFIAMGGLATGVVAAGGMSVGLLGFGGMAIGLVNAFGGMAIGALARGGMAVGYNVAGGLGIGLVGRAGSGGNFIENHGFSAAMESTHQLAQAGLLVGFAVVMVGLVVGVMALFSPERREIPSSTEAVSRGRRERLGLMLFLLTVLAAFAAFVFLRSRRFPHNFGDAGPGHSAVIASSSP